MNEKPKVPQHLEINPKPLGIIKYKKTPLLLLAIFFGGLIIFLVFNMTQKQDSIRKRNKQELENPKLSQASTKGNQQYWFHQKQYDRIAAEEKTKAPDLTFKLNRINTVEPKSSEEEAKFLQDFEKEKFRTQLELFRIEQKNQVEDAKIFKSAVKSSAKISVSRNFGSQGQQKISDEKLPSNTDDAMRQFNQTQQDNDQNRQQHKEAFLKADFTGGEYLPHFKKSPLSPYEVKAGSIIPAAMVSGLNSDLPGHAIAQVRENVYDTVTGNYLLIPQGSRLIGDYDSQISFGQNRALVVWRRLIFPDGSSLNLDKMQGVDIAGYAGFKDKVNNHYLRIYGNALLLSLVGAGFDFTKQNNSTSETEDAVVASIGEQLAQVTTEVLRRNINVQPTIIIRPGYKFNVIVMKDIILENYEF